MLSLKKDQWFSNIRSDVLAGLVVGLALIPESIAFSVIAGVDPKVGLYASFCIAVVIAFVGGRQGMISAATGAMAILMVLLVKEHGLQYLLAATVLTGILQIVASYLKLANLMRFVSKSVVSGFLNALAILIFTTQINELMQMTWQIYILVLFGIAIIYLFPSIPKIGQIIPSPLVSIIVISAVVIILGLDARTVSDMGTLPDTLPIFLIPDIPLNWETLTIIFPYAIAMATVGLLESMMTANVLDEITQTSSDKHQECKGQGVANIAAGFTGGMAGCAMIGQSLINVKSGGRTRLSTLCAGLFLIILVVFLSDWIGMIPMAALVAVMIMVAISTFEWRSVAEFTKNPMSSNIIMLSTVALVLATHNLALGVLIGVVLSALFLAQKMEKDVDVISHLDAYHRCYIISGQIFFSSAQKLKHQFDYDEDIQSVTMDFQMARIWDPTAVATIESIILKFEKNGINVTLLGLDEKSHLLLKTHNTSLSL